MPIEGSVEAAALSQVKVGLFEVVVQMVQGREE